MTDSILPDWQAMSNFLMSGVMLEANVAKASSSVRASAKSGYKQEWLDARLQLLSTLSKLIHAKANVAGSSDNDRSHRILLLIAFLQGTTATELLISEGQYIKAAAVLKQDYEILTRIREVKAGVARVGQTPQVKHAPEGSQRFYGALNNIAHPSNPDQIAQLLNVQQSGQAVGPTYLPSYVESTSNGMYELHVWLILEMTREALVLFVELYSLDDPDIQQAFTEFALPIDLLQTVGFVVEA